MITLVITAIAELMAKINCDLKTLLKVRFAIKKAFVLDANDSALSRARVVTLQDKDFAQKRTCERLKNNKCRHGNLFCKTAFLDDLK